MQVSHQEMKQIFLMFKNIERHVTQHFEKRLGISLTRYEILYKLLEMGLLSQIGLQQEMKIDQAAITRHLKILEGKGFVTRNRNEQNNREVIVQITEAGKDILRNCDVDKNQFIAELFGGFSEQEVKQLQILVKKLDHNVEKLI
ncbi:MULTISPECIES: MarR family winged helix-turn-helix transcriptional regulator [Paenibacillus]|uniref:MarR family transcriptional regulator n=2 Tax=Paenibacillus TaxID=44249 RepID=A0ABT4E8Y1_PAEAL|nr:MULTISPECIES: MarR family transcriptional regulator [Paenibacillus]MCY9530201.1 MarR family transcriptional regulator [Paenibacillus alvei]TQR46326.1 MarR family transcriptional regulator [Paenibacillus sp. SDF0028]SDF65745.1 DNA-binding transcriptional regulator, MarR family [Paenibacillus sp. cl6col]